MQMTDLEGVPVVGSFEEWQAVRYRSAAEGEIVIHSFSINGSRIRELRAAPYKPLDADEWSWGTHGDESDAHLGPAEYDGVLSREECAEIAESFQATI